MWIDEEVGVLFVVVIGECVDVDVVDCVCSYYVVFEIVDFDEVVVLD